MNVVHYCKRRYSVLGVVVDVAVCAIFAVAIIIGITRGFVKQLSAILRGLVALVGSILLTALLLNALQTTGLYQSFIQVTSGWFSSDTMVIVVNSPNDLALVLSQHNSLKILAGLSEVLYNDMQTYSLEGFPCNTLGALLGHYVANLISGFILWIVFLLIFKAIFKGLIKLLNEIIIMPAFKTLDRILGAVWVLGITYVIAIGVVFAGIEALILKFLPATWDKLADFIQNTTVLLWLHDTNVLGELIAGMLNITIPTINL